MMSISDLTPEEQETLQKSKDPSVIMAATVPTHTKEEATTNVCELDMFLPVQLPFGRKPIRTISGVFGIHWQMRIRFFVVAEIVFLIIRIFGVVGFQLHAMRLYM